MALKGTTSNGGFTGFLKQYKWHVVIWIIGLMIFANYAYHKLTDSVVLLNGIMLNTNYTEDENRAAELADEFAQIQNIDTNVYSITFDGSLTYIPGDDSDTSGNYESGQAILIQEEEEELDFITGPQDTMLDLAYNSLFMDLTQFFSEEELALYEPYFLYVDQAVIEQLEEAFDKEEDISSIVLPDPTKPEDMKSPAPVLLDMSQCEKLRNVYGDSTDTLFFGIIGNAPNRDLILEFIKYIME